MAKYKVGDKVRVRDGCESTNELYFDPQMKQYEGEIVTIRDVYPRECRYRIEEDTGNSFLSLGWCWDESWLMPATFTKADLKDGMVVEMRDGTRRLVLGQKFRGETDYMPFDKYQDDLLYVCSKYDNSYDIVKVYTSRGNPLNNLFKSLYLDLVWERKEEEPVKEMTIEEIEKLVGCKVKVVGSEGM